jgi:hypothetical protein
MKNQDQNKQSSLSSEGSKESVIKILDRWQKGVQESSSKPKNEYQYMDGVLGYVKP